MLYYLHNLIAYTDNGEPLYGRYAKNRTEARRYVTYSPYAFRTGYVIYKSKQYKLKDIIKW